MQKVGSLFFLLILTCLTCPQSVQLAPPGLVPASSLHIMNTFSTEKIVPVFFLQVLAVLSLAPLPLLPVFNAPSALYFNFVPQVPRERVAQGECEHRVSGLHLWHLRRRPRVERVEAVGWTRNFFSAVLGQTPSPLKTSSLNSQNGQRHYILTHCIRAINWRICNRRLRKPIKKHSLNNSFQKLHRVSICLNSRALPSSQPEVVWTNAFVVEADAKVLDSDLHL